MDQKPVFSEPTVSDERGKEFLAHVRQHLAQTVVPEVTTQLNTIFERVMTSVVTVPQPPGMQAEELGAFKSIVAMEASMAAIQMFGYFTGSSFSHAKLAFTDPASPEVSELALKNCSETLNMSINAGVQTSDAALKKEVDNIKAMMDSASKQVGKQVLS